MKNIKVFSLEELKSEMADLGLESYRARQIFLWLWQRGVSDFDSMTNLSKDLRRKLSNDYYIGQLKIIEDHRAGDDTIKLLLGLEDGEMIETVFIPEGRRQTVCVSTQVGCPLGCSFCASGKIGFIRSLAAWEIVDQILRIRDRLKVRVSNVVFMGIGEPLLNLNEVLRAISIINSDSGLNIGARHITVSTAGIIPGIRSLARFSVPVKIAISLNSTTDTVRNRLMPINRTNPLRRLFNAIRYYVKIQHRRVTFEYILIAGVNDQPEDASRLIRLLRGIPSKINIIPLNEIPGSGLKRPDDEQVLKFIDQLKYGPVAVTLRKSRGKEIMAGCGQLRANYG